MKLSTLLAFCVSLFVCEAALSQNGSLSLIEDSLRFSYKQHGIDELPPSVVVGNTGRPMTAAIKRANELGLTGRWIVVSSEKDGMFTTAQIGQEPGDIITIGQDPSGITVPVG